MSSSQQDQTPTIQQKEQQKAESSPTKQLLTSTPQTKKTASYTYWVDQKNKSRQLPPQQRPQKIQAPTSVNQQVDNGRSHWNTAGTWEHRKISVSEVEKIYAEKVSEWLAAACPEAKVSKVSLSGECEVVFTRNKKALTYQITGKVQFQKTVPSTKEEETEVENEKPSTKEEYENQDSELLDLSTEEKEDESNNKNKKKAKSSAKTKNLTFEITDLTDSGDRDHTVKADTPDDKKWIAGQSNKLLSLLEEILKSYK